MFYLIQDNALKEIYFGPQGFQLFTTQLEQESAQEQFIQPGEESLWNSQWLVIGLDTELGDPYIAVKGDEDSTIYTAIFNGQRWELIPVSSSFGSFIACISHIYRVNPQLEPQFVPDNSSLQDQQQINNLQDTLVNTSGCKEFWCQFISCYLDWLKD